MHKFFHFIALLIAGPIAMAQQYPSWWTSGSSPVINSGVTTVNNNAVANAGQGKWVAMSALGALQDVLGPYHPTVLAIESDLYVQVVGEPGVFDPFIPASPSQDWYELQQVPLQIGSLKALAYPFYVHLSEICPSWVSSQLVSQGLNLNTNFHLDAEGTYVPWDPSNNTDASVNHAVSNIGQLKLVFALDLTEIDCDGDGLSNLTEIANGFDPLDSADVNAGTNGNDSINSTAGGLQILGLDGDDTIYVDGGDNVVIAGAGDDVLYGDWHSDTSDVYLWNWGDGYDYINDVDGLNTLLFGKGVSPEDVAMERGEQGYPFNLSSNWIADPADDDLRFQVTSVSPGESGTIVIYDWYHAKQYWQIKFLSHPEVVWSGKFMATDGRDYLVGDLVGNELLGGAGNDYLYGDEYASSSFGRKGGNDRLYGGEDDDIIYGHGGDDLLSGDGGNDQLFGGEDDDDYRWNWGGGHDFVEEDYANQGFNTLTLGSGVDPSSVTVERDEVHQYGGTNNYLTDWSHDPSEDDIRFSMTHPSNSTLSGSLVIKDWHTDDDIFSVAFEDDRYTVWESVQTGTAAGDTLTSTTVSELLVGYDGDDTYKILALDRPDYIREEDELSPSTDSDVVEFGSAISPSDITLTKDGNDLVIMYESGAVVSWLRVYKQFDSTTPAKIEAIHFVSNSGSNLNEAAIDATTALWDTDADGMPNWWEDANGLNSLVDDSSSDSDLDGLLALSEFELGTDPDNDDSDGDGLSDGHEISQTLTSPLEISSVAFADADGDGLSYTYEVEIGSDPNNWDSNGDGVSDGETDSLGLDPTASDPDGDGLTTAQELALGTSPVLADTDGDGVDDDVDTSPLDPNVSGIGAPSGDSTPPVIDLIAPIGAVVQ